MTAAPLRFTEYLRLCTEVMAIGAALCGLLVGSGLVVFRLFSDMPADAGIEASGLVIAPLVGLFFAIGGISVAALCLPLAVPVGWLAWSALASLGMTARLWATTAAWCLSCLALLLSPRLFMQPMPHVIPWVTLSSAYAMLVPGGMIGGLFAPKRYRLILARREAAA